MTAPELAHSAEEKRRALDEVLQSNAFARADQLKRFLRYICEMEMAGRADEISEYTIGTEALGRPSGYSPGDDSTVRSRAHSLRQKLEEFYEREGAAASVRIEMRKGAYTPHYISAAPAQPVVLTPPTVEVPRRQITPALAFVAGAGLIAVLAVAAWVLAPKPAPTRAVDPIVQKFWGPLLQPDGQVILCVASAPSMLLKSYKDGIIPKEARIYPAPPEVSDWYAGLQMLDGGGKLYSQTSNNTNLLGDTIAAITAAKVLSGAGSPFQVLPEYSVRPLAFRGRNVLLVGGPNYSPLAARVLRQTPFSVRYDSSRKEDVIFENNPKEGVAPVTFVPKRDELNRLTEAYGLLTVLPSPPAGEGLHRTVIFTGIASAGTQAAMEFFASPQSLRDLEKRFLADGHAIPEGYQVVVRCGLDRLLALSFTYETHRAIESPNFVY